MKLTTLCYIERDDCYLMLHRVKKKHDANYDKWIGVGGKLEDGETPEECLLREVREETGFTLTKFRLRGMITFVSDVWETEMIYLYTADGFTGRQRECAEGELVWVKKSAVAELNLWEGDRIFFDLLGEDQGVFSLKLRYEGEALAEQKLVKDVTGDYRRSAELVEEACAANKAKTSFLSEMSHDIRTPMNAIIGMTDIAMAQEELPERVKYCLEKIQTTSGHMMSLLNEVLDISRIESGKIVIQKESLDMADLVHEVLVVATAQAEAKKLRLRFCMGEMAQECVMADPVRLKQIFLNLISNAVKYTEKGNVDFWLSIEEQSQGNVWMKACIQDTGIGIAPEFLERIFEPFEREHSATVSKIQGTGLGMAITKKLVEMMNGKIELESEQNRGTVVNLEIPLEPIPQDEDAFQRKLSGRRVLFLSEDATQARLVEGMLERVGMSMDWAASGEEAVTFLNECCFNGTEYFALLTVEHLPDVEIMLLLPQIRNRMGSEFPMLLLSRGDWSQTEYMLKQSGVSGFVPLPLFRSRLYQALCEYVGESRTQYGPAESEENFQFSGRRLMLVEDNELNREIAIALLEDTQVEIVPAEDGQQAVSLFEASTYGYYDMILMDIQMPVMNGLESARRIRSLERADAQSVPIIAMTANAFAEDVQNSLDAGMNAHISKPMDMSKVLPCMQKYLGGDRQ